MPREKDAVDGCARIITDMLGGFLLSLWTRVANLLPMDQIRLLDEVLLEHSYGHSFEECPWKLSHSACAASHCHRGHGKYHP